MVFDSSSANVERLSKQDESQHEFLSGQVEDSVQEPSTKVVAKAISTYAALALIVLSTLGALLVTTLGPGSFVSVSGSCHPDGTFRYLQDYNPWATSGLFQITLGFGSMSFSDAKLTDVIRDVVVGPGGDVFPPNLGRLMLIFPGQWNLGCIAYSVFTKSLVRIMEQRPISYRTFEAITFHSSTIVSILFVIRDFATNGGRRAKATFTWIIIVFLYVLAFSTLTSAVTGYASNSQGRFS